MDPSSVPGIPYDPRSLQWKISEHKARSNPKHIQVCNRNHKNIFFRFGMEILDQIWCLPCIYILHLSSGPASSLWSLITESGVSPNYCQMHFSHRFAFICFRFAFTFFLLPYMWLTIYFFIFLFGVGEFWNHGLLLALKQKLLLAVCGEPYKMLSVRARSATYKTKALLSVLLLWT